MTERTGPEMRINLADAKDVQCDKCGDVRFEQVYLIKKLSALVSPTGKDEMIPLGLPICPPIFACYSCGWINEEFVPLPLRKSVGKTESNDSGIVSSNIKDVIPSSKIKKSHLTLLD